MLPMIAMENVNDDYQRMMEYSLRKYLSEDEIDYFKRNLEEIKARKNSGEICYALSYDANKKNLVTRSITFDFKLQMVKIVRTNHIGVPLSDALYYQISVKEFDEIIKRYTVRNVS